jgi:hypothetical protein
MNHDSDVEIRLQAFSPKAPAPGRREKILRGVKERRLACRILTPVWKWTLVGCAALLLIICLADGWTSMAGLRRLQALLNIPEPGALSLERAVEEELAAYREILTDLDEGFWDRLQIALTKERRAAKTQLKPSFLEELFYEN